MSPADPVADSPSPPSGPPPGEAGQRRRRRRLASAAAGALLAFHFAAFDFAEQAIATDIRYYLYFAWRLTDGVPPHVAGFDPKTQLATFAGALFHAAGEGVGARPLLAVRVGYLGLAALCGWLAFVAHRRLSAGAVGGGLGLLAFCSFGLVGALSATGNWPKLLMAVASYGAALLVHDRRWLAGGAVSAVAFLDWQIGAIVCVAVLLSALLFAERRAAAAGRVLLGGALALAPYVLYFAAEGALGVAVEQSFVSSFHRGEAFLERRSFAEDVARMHRMVSQLCAGQYALALAGFSGVAVALARLARGRDDPRRPLLFVLTLVFGGVVAFTFVDFQGRPDAALLLVSLAFFLGLSYSALHGFLVRRAPRHRTALGVAALLVAGGLARPGPLHPEVDVNSRVLGRRATLSDQEEVARDLAALTANRTLAMLQSSELLYLMRRVNAAPTIYWNVANLSFFRRSPDETDADVVPRLLQEAGADAVVFVSRHFLVQLSAGWSAVRLQSDNGAYGITVYLHD